jgi:hypothetical protein
MGVSDEDAEAGNTTETDGVAVMVAGLGMTAVTVCGVGVG